MFDDAVREFSTDLLGFYKAKTGNELSVFFARDSIGWGDDWRARIDSELENASIFMPIITMRYFNSSACRDELNTFNQGALRLGVQYLILPVVIAGAREIRSDHPIPEVATIKALQYKDLEEVFLEGPGTREWRKALSGLTDELIDLISRGELAAPSLVPATSVGVEKFDTAEDSGDFLTSMEELESLVPNLAREAEQVLESLESWSGIVQESTSRIKPGLTVQRMQAVSIGIADQLKNPSRKLHDAGVGFAATVEKADAVMNTISDQISQIPTQEGKDSMAAFIAPMRQTADLNEVVTNMAELLESMASVEVYSAPLRNSLKPARIGITKVHDAVRVMNRWAKEA
ncbi:toll/interleukin-1 receptor domain-containing protein [Streptomyces drozdowiczii]